MWKSRVNSFRINGAGVFSWAVTHLQNAGSEGNELALEVPQAADFRLRVTRPTGSQGFGSVSMQKDIFARREQSAISCHSDGRYAWSSVGDRPLFYGE
jgi:hypothetical protein